MRRKLLAAGALALAPYLPSPSADPGPFPGGPAVRDAESLPPEFWSFRKLAPGVLEIRVPVLTTSWAELGRPPESLELLVFDTPVPDSIPLDQLDEMAPVARVAVGMSGRGPGAVPFEVAGLAPGQEYSAALVAHFAGEEEPVPDEAGGTEEG